MKQSFRNAYVTLPYEKRLSIRNQVMKKLGFDQKQKFYNRMKGFVELTVNEASYIEEIFARHGVYNIFDS